MYVNMPPFGLGRAGERHAAAGARMGAAGRLGANGSPANDTRSSA